MTDDLREMKIFTKEELGRYDGEDGIAYIAYNGKVYDVSKSFHWKKGIHQVIHHAGSDLTGLMGQAPHSAEMLKRFPVIGEMKD